MWVMLDRAAWVAFLAFAPVLWATGIWLFVHSGLAPRKQIVWSLALVCVGVAIGFVLPLPSIRNRFLVLVVALPLLAVVDVTFARSNRSFFFWLRACAFEVCTVFASATLTRFLVFGHEA